MTPDDRQHTGAFTARPSEVAADDDDPNGIADALDALTKDLYGAPSITLVTVAARLLRESAGVAERTLMVADNEDTDGERLLFYVDGSGVIVKCGYLFADAPADAGLEVNPAGTADRLVDLLDAIDREDPRSLALECDEDGLTGLAATLGRIAAAVDAAREDRCACGQPATTTVAGIPTCGDDR